jgi:hypothetical protein
VIFRLDAALAASAPNPTRSANLSFFVSNDLHGVLGSPPALRLDFAFANAV